MPARRFTTTTAAALGAAFALSLPLAAAEAQFGKILKKAAEKVVVDKAVDKAAEKAGVGNAGGGGAAAAAQPVTDDLVQKVLAYDEAQVAEYGRILSTDPRYRSYQTARTEYERCYAKDLGFQKSARRLTRLSEQARIDGRMDAHSRYADSLNNVRMTQLKTLPQGCAIPEMSSELADAAAAEGRTAAEKKTGTSDRQMGMITERITGYLRLAPADRKAAVTQGGYTAAEVAVIEKNLAALERWAGRASGMQGPGADPQAVARYQDEMTRFRAGYATYEACLQGAQSAMGTPAMPPSMQAQMASMKEPTPAQQKEMERLGNLGEAAADRKDMVKAKAYSDSVQALLGIKIAPQDAAERQAFAKQTIEGHKKMEAAMKKCGVPPDEPIRPAYVR